MLLVDTWIFYFTRDILYLLQRDGILSRKFDGIDEQRCIKILRRKICSCFCDIFTLSLKYLAFLFMVCTVAFSGSFFNANFYHVYYFELFIFQYL